MTPEEEIKYRQHQAGYSDFMTTFLRERLTGKRKPFLTDEEGNRLEDQDVKGPGTYGIRYDSNSVEDPLLDCVYSIDLHWDQWVLCAIHCHHGRFDGVSDYFNITEAVIRAIIEFNDHDHPLEAAE